MAYSKADAKRCILHEGLTGGYLIMILNAWVSGEDAVFWNRKGAYVPQLIPVALSLLAQGMIEIWEEPLPLGEGEGSLMTADPAAEALADPRNWWRYDPEDDSDPEDPGPPVGETDADWEPMTTYYSVLSTSTA